MSESTRPTVQSVQRSLIVGVLIGIIFGCILGTSFGTYYAWQVNPVQYVGDAVPSELANSYQNHYLAMVVDSYLVNQEADIASARLETFDQAGKVRMLAERSAAYAAAGRGVEAQLISNLAVALKSSEGWNDDIIRGELGQLTTQYQSDSARMQAISAFSAQLLDGQVPVPAGETPAAGAPAEQPAAQAPPPPPPPGGLPWLRILLCCLGLVIVGLIIYILGRRQFEARRAYRPQKIEWEGEGKPPLKQWKGTFNLGDDNYDEFFTIETEEGDFLGESGIGIMEAVPGTSPKQVLAFDVGLFDKTDITTLSRVVMSEHAFNDEAMREKIEANPQAEAVLAEAGKNFTFETTALRVEAEIEAVEYDDDNVYFTKLSSNLKVFLKEGADLKRGEMDIPEEYQS